MNIPKESRRIYKLKRKWALWLACLLLLSGCTGRGGGNPNDTTSPAGEQELTEIENGLTLSGFFYKNTLSGNVADPYILVHDGVYYLVCTGGSRFTVKTSKDLVTWKEKSEPLITLADTGWAVSSGWAPELYEYNGKFYLLFSAVGQNGLAAIDIAVCDTPDGKFVPLKKGQPFYAPNYTVIDGNLFFDDDGRVYMYYSKSVSTNIIDGNPTSQTWGIEVKPDLSGVIGEPVLIATPEQPWELKSGSTRWNEGPAVFKENGTYYLLYSANYYATENYSVGYATSDTPLRRFDKPTNSRLLYGNGKTVTGPGHCSVFRSPDGTEMYMAYHVHTVPPTADGGRSLAIDRLLFREDGSLAVDGPSETRRPLPSGLNGFTHVTDYTYSGSGEKAEFAASSNIDNLFDGIADASVRNIYSMDEGGKVEIKLTTPTELATVLVYPSSMGEYAPGSVDVTVNGTYVIRELPFAGNLGNPATVTLTNLPEGTKVESLTLTVHLKKGNEYAALAEIILISQAK